MRDSSTDRRYRPVHRYFGVRTDVQTRTRDYLRVTPTTGTIQDERILNLFERLSRSSAPSQPTLIERMHPRHSQTPSRFEFLALSEGSQAPVTFYYRATEQFDLLEKRLRSNYPQTFDIEPVKLDSAARLIRPTEYTVSEFLSACSDVTLFDSHAGTERIDPAAETVPRHIKNVLPESDTDSPVDTIPELAAPDQLEDVAALHELDRPTITPDDTILARPAVDTCTPISVQWQATADVRQDWMTLLQHDPTTDPTDRPLSHPGGDLTTLVEYLMDADAPIAFQVVFQHRPDWSEEADHRVLRLKQGRDTWAQKLHSLFLDTDSDDPIPDREHLDDGVIARLDQIKAKQTSRSFVANIRAVGLPTSPEQRQRLLERMHDISAVLESFSGSFYGIEGSCYGADGRLSRIRSQAVFRRLLHGDLITGWGRTCPQFILDPAELANFATVPASTQLTIGAHRGTRAEQRARNPLPLPNPDLLQQFQTGMAIGYALDQTGTPRSDPVKIPPSELTTHYGRFASSGSGKSKAVINDALTLRESTDGPVVIIDPKGDGMCENYLRCHYTRFDDLADVYLFSIPDYLPAISFFDIRPALEDGVDRSQAIQSKVEHFHEIMRLVMDSGTYDRAEFGTAILGNLIRALFDQEYGSDVFGLGELFAAARELQQEQTIPPLSPENDALERALLSELDKDREAFRRTIGSVLNRLNKLQTDDYFNAIFSHTPARGSDDAEHESHFTFRELLSEDVTILFDLGAARSKTQRVLTLLLLSNLWDALQARRASEHPSEEAPLVNLILEESAEVVASNLVTEELLPKGRAFGLCLGLVMQYPGQVKAKNETAYRELLTNVETKLIGNLTMEDELAASLVHEDLSTTDLRHRANTLPSGEWIAKLPDPQFNERAPLPFSIEPLPIPAGHPESDSTLSAAEEQRFETRALSDVIDRSKARFALTNETTESSTETWGSPGNDRAAADQRTGDVTSSTFIGAPTSDSETPSTEATIDQEPSSETAATTESTSRPLSTMGSSVGSTNPERETSTGDPSESPSSALSNVPLESFDIPVSESQLEEHGLSRDDARFLNQVFAVMNRSSEEYTLLDSMTTFRDDLEDLDVDRLIDQGLLEEATACRRKYYTVLPEGRQLLGKSLDYGHGNGDLGEKTPHKVGVKLLEEWLDRKEAVDRVVPYYKLNEETIFDVAALDDSDTLVWVGEVELPSHNREAPIADYDKLQAVDADVVWAFDKRETATKILKWLVDSDRLDCDISGRDARTFANIRSTVEALDADGMTTIRSFHTLDEVVNA